MLLSAVIWSVERLSYSYLGLWLGYAALLDMRGIQESDSPTRQRDSLIFGTKPLLLPMINLRDGWAP